jgi:hypothetical protein
MRRKRRLFSPFLSSPQSFAFTPLPFIAVSNLVRLERDESERCPEGGSAFLQLSSTVF